MTTITWLRRHKFLEFSKLPRKKKHTFLGIESSRGRHAAKPYEIPVKGLKDTFYRVREEISEDNLSMMAAGMSYYILLALVPALSSLVMIYAWISNPADIMGHLDSIARIIPVEIMETLRTQLTTLATKEHTKLGIGAIGTLLFSLWSASKGSQSVMDALNVIYDEKDNRGVIKSALLAICLTFLGTVLSLLAIAVIVGFPAVTAFFHFGDRIETLVGVSSWVILLGIFSFFLSLIYRYGPDRNRAKWSWVSPGALIASLLWAVVSAGFSWYAKEFGHFNKTYGSLGAIVVLMMWFYLSSYVVLLGAEINAELEHQTLKDRTKGFPKPLGARDATMANTVGRAKN